MKNEGRVMTARGDRIDGFDESTINSINSLPFNQLTVLTLVYVSPSLAIVLYVFLSVMAVSVAPNENTGIFQYDR